MLASFDSKLARRTAAGVAEGFSESRKGIESGCHLDVEDLAIGGLKESLSVGHVTEPETVWLGSISL